MNNQDSVKAGRDLAGESGKEGAEADAVAGQPGFTPGPWVVDDRRCAPLPNISIVGADGTRVAEAQGVHMRDKMLRWNPADANAADARAMSNALLIAAAPDLYETLQRIERWFGEFPATGKTWDDGSPMSYVACYGTNGERDYIRGIARVALALADGQVTNTEAEHEGE